MIRRLMWLPVALAAVLACADPAAAFGRRGGRGCGTCVPCCAPCVPLCPGPCHPLFTFWARLENPSGKVDPDQPIPFEVYLTNFECYWWRYLQSDYHFYVLDDHGRVVPDALQLPYLYREIWVPPCVSIIDKPRFIRIRKGALQNGKTYTLVIRLLGHYTSFRFVPFQEFGKGGETASAAGPATIVATLPADAVLTIDDEPTTSTSGRRVFTTPALPGGKECHYTFRAEVVRDGKVLSVTRRITVRAGEETRVHLEIPRTVVAAK